MVSAHILLFELSLRISNFSQLSLNQWRDRNLACINMYVDI